MQELIEINVRLLSRIKFSFLRYLYHQIDWNDRLIEINGARGVGKTTLMLQKVKEINKASKSSALYASLDNPFFFQNSITDVADAFFKNGGNYLFLDEVHKYPALHKNYDWSAELKAVYDAFPDLKIVYSGSSILKLYQGQGDISRRRSVYHFNGLSFREFLQFDQDIEIAPTNLSNLINHHEEISSQISNQTNILPLFSTYIENGYYPFYKESKNKYFEKLKDVINVILETDIPAVTDIPFETLLNIKKLLGAIGSSVPYTPNLSDIRSRLYISDQRTLLKYLNYLEKAEIIKTLSKNVSGKNILKKPDKIYLNNTNLLKALNFEKHDTGTIRETFFYNQVSNNYRVTYPSTGDFKVNDYVFEVGGKNKKQKQIENIDNAFLVLDNIEVGFAKKIPLWLFGFLY